MERLIGTVRRQCLDQMLIFGEAHLRHILSGYAKTYNEVRTHRALGKNTPSGRTVQRTGVIIATKGIFLKLVQISLSLNRVGIPASS